MTTIRQPDLELAPIIYPSLDEQERILLIITSIDNQIEELESKKTSLEKIKKGLMQKLLTGQIRVKV
jgi:type I restriction enzyme S subunit